MGILIDVQLLDNPGRDLRLLFTISGTAGSWDNGDAIFSKPMDTFSSVILSAFELAMVVFDL